MTREPPSDSSVSRRTVLKRGAFASAVGLAGISSLSGTGLAAGSVIEVPDDESTIQAAIDAASDGDTIRITSGTYVETLNVQGFDGLTIEGTDREAVVIRPNSTMDWGPETNYPGRTTSVRVVNATDVTLRDLTFDFADVDDTAVTGLLFWESTGGLHDNAIRGMSHDEDVVDLTSYFGTDDPDASSYSPADRARVEITGNDFEETGRIGINVDDFVHAVVEDNTFSTTDFGYGIEIGSEATGEIRENEIRGYDTVLEGPGEVSAGIYVENAFAAEGVDLTKTVVLEDNDVSDCQFGAWIGQIYDSTAGGSFGSVSIDAVLRGNAFHDNRKAGVAVSHAGADEGHSVTVRGSENTLARNDNYGYYVYEDNRVSDEDDAAIVLDVERETIRDNRIGLLVTSTSPAPVESFERVAVTTSTVSGNEDVGVKNTVDALTVDAECNWWGHATGPTHPDNPNGKGDRVAGNVDYRPWSVRKIGRGRHPEHSCVGGTRNDDEDRGRDEGDERGERDGDDRDEGRDSEEEREDGNEDHDDEQGHEIGGDSDDDEPEREAEEGQPNDEGGDRGDGRNHHRERGHGHDRGRGH